MAFLYINSRGEPWRRHSYSAGNTYDQSPYKYYMSKVIGWREKEDMARFAFGHALESAIQFYHDNDGRGITEKFVELWAPAKDVSDMIYTKTEKDWPTLNRIGVDMTKLYAIRQPSLPVPLGAGSVFQREYAKEVFPGDPNYGEIEDVGRLDIVCYVDPKHSALVPVDWRAEFGPLRPLIVDIKTSGVDFPESMGMAAFDKQLRRYSWQSGIRDVALMWFVKKGLGYKKGSRVTLLINKGDYSAGTEMYIANAGKDRVYLVGSQLAMASMDEAQGRKEDGSLDTTKAAVTRKMDWLTEHGLGVTEEDFTRQRLQFNAGFVTADSANDAGQIAGRQIVQIVNSWKNKQWPNTFGIRYPHDDRRDPFFRAFVLGDKVYQEEHFRMANPDEVDNLFEEDPEAEGDDE